MGGNVRLSTREIDASIIIVIPFRESSWPTTRRAAERSGMMRYCRVLVVSRTWPGMSLSLVKMHILIAFPTCLLVTCLINSDPFSCTHTSLLHNCVHIFTYITHRCAVLTLTDLCICSLFNLDSYVYIFALTLYYFQKCRRQSDQLVAFPCFHRFSHLCHSKLPSLQDLICSPLKTIMALFDRPKALSLVWCLRDEWCCEESSTAAWLGARHFQHSDYFTFSDSVYILPALKRSLCSCLFETISNWSKSNRAGEIPGSAFLLYAKLFFSTVMEYSGYCVQVYCPDMTAGSGRTKPQPDFNQHP